MVKTKFIKMVDAYESECENGKVKAYKDGDVNSHIHWRGRLTAAKEFRQMMLDGAFDFETNEQPSVVDTAADKGLILTEEELKSYEMYVSPKLITSHRSLNSRNLKLVLENDELMAENEKLKRILEGLTYDQPIPSNQ